MKILQTEDFLKMENPNPGEVYRSEILTREDQANDLGAIFGLLPPKFEGPLHYHEKRESLLMVLSGQGIEIYGDRKIPVKSGDILFIPPGVKHGLINTSEEEFRYLEFFTYPPVLADVIMAE
ncbi:MAG: cupin domain-containing protein [Pseudomonadota bacterium]